jgi:hypothetical protein
MIGKCVWFCGVQRAYHITDSELVAEVHNHVAVLNHVKYPCRLLEDNMRRVNSEPHLLSVVPRGRPCLLIMCKLAGIHTTVLYDPKGRHTFLALPLRFDAQVFASEPVFSCTFNHTHRVVVIDDLLAMRREPLWHEPLDRRALAVHDMIHNLYRPDSFLLPLKVEIRRYFGYSQLEDVVALSRSLPYPSHAISIKPMPLDGRELLAFLNARPVRAAPAPRPCDGQYTVTKGEGPDIYYAIVPHSAPQLLSIRTLQQSAFMARAFTGGVGSRQKMDLRWEDGRLTITDEC